MKRVLFLLGIVLSLTSVNASDNVLQTIEINPVKDTYNVVLIADKAVDVKKNVQAPNKIQLTMKGIRASKTLNTVYNNVTDVDTVLVEQHGDSVSVFFQADNAANSTITFDSLSPAPIQPTPAVKSIKLNNPIESYAPIYSEDYKTDKTSGLFDKFNFKKNVNNDLKDSLEDESSSDTLNKFFSFGLIGLFVVAVVKLFRRKEPEMKIGLQQSLNDREVSMFGGVQPFGMNMQAAEKPFTTVNYGLNAYQKGNVNPYESVPMTIHNPRLRNAMPLNQQEMIAQAVAQQQMQQQIQQQRAMAANAQQTAKKMTTPINSSAVNQKVNANIENLKFLESMTAIYEKSGRHDLAKGLKESLTKNSVNAPL